jgi:lipopolysaccharide transport system ATP-binding protein
MSSVAVEPISDSTPSGSVSASDAIIKVEGVSKVYHLWESPSARLKHAVIGSLADVVPGRAREVLRAKNARYRTDFCALHDFSLRVERGHSVGIIGKNGSGKSTLLQIIAGTLRPTFGTVSVRGRVAALLELGSGFNPDFSGEENVFLNATLLGMTKGEIDQRYDDILRFADIGNFITQPVRTYSSGMIVRLGFSVAAHANAEILIVDEALAVGDVFFQQKCYRRIREIIESGTTFLFVSHDFIAMQSICQTGVLLECGRKVFEGPADACAHRYMRETFAIPVPTRPQDTPDSAGKTERVTAEPGERQVKLDLTEPVGLEVRSVDERIAKAAAAIDLLPTARSRHGEKWMEFLAMSLTDLDGEPVMSVAMGDEVYLTMLVRVNRGIVNPEVVFRLIDRLGNLVFCTCNSSLRHDLGEFVAGSEFAVRFRTRLSVDVGHYTFTLETGKQADDRPNIGIYFEIVEGVGPIQVFDPRPDEVRPYYGMAQLPCEMEVF